MFGISSVNVNGLNDPNKHNTIFTHFKNSGDDIFFLQDLRADSKNKLDKWLQKWEGPSYSAGKDKSSSIAILFRKNTQFEVNKISEDENGRFLLVNGTKDDKNVTLCNIYAPSGPQKFKERKLFFENLKASISEFQPDNSKLILGSDFNCVTDVDLDRSRMVSKTDSSVNKLKNILNNFQPKDIWRYQNPDKKEFTFYSIVGTGSRLDKFYLTKDLTPNVVESKIQNFAHSDHDKVNIKLDLSETERGPGLGLWKINNSYLHDPDYVKEITRMWYLHQFKKDENDDLNGWWVEGKTRIKEISLNFSKRKNRENKNYKHNLRKQFRNVKNKLDRDPSNVNCKYLYNKIN